MRKKTIFERVSEINFLKNMFYLAGFIIPGFAYLYLANPNNIFYNSDIFRFLLTCVFLSLPSTLIMFIIHKIILRNEKYNKKYFERFLTDVSIINTYVIYALIAFNIYWTKWNHLILLLYYFISILIYLIWFRNQS